MESYTLMHRDVPVLDMKLLDGRCVNVTKIHNQKHIMPGCKKPILGTFDTGRFAEKWNQRTIPITRQNLKITTTQFPGISTPQLSLYSAFANLSDQYWAKPTGSELTYKDISFFLNDFTSNFNQILLSAENQTYAGMPDIHTPSCSTGGDMPKAWAIEPDGTRVLYKASGTAFHQEPLNERLGTALNQLLGAEHIPYQTKIYNNILCTTCPCCVDQYHEIIPAYDILQEIAQIGHTKQTPFDDLLEYQTFAKTNDIPDIDKNLAAMILTDYILRNTDRHWTNFGLIRNAETLQYESTLPLFDYGNSLFHNHARITAKTDAVSKLTGQMLYQDLKFITRHASLTGLHTENLCEFPKIAARIINNSGLSQTRAENLINTVTWRTQQACDYLDILCQSHHERTPDHGPEYC